MCEQHLDLLAVAPGLREGVGLGECTSNVAGFLVDIAWHLTLWRLRTTLGFERAWSTIVRAGHIEQRRAAIDQPATGLQGFAGGTSIGVALFVIREVLSRERPIFALRLVDDRDMRCDSLLVDEPFEVGS